MSISYIDHGHKKLCNDFTGCIGCLAGPCNVPTINQATITPRQAQVSIGQQITVTCTGESFIDGGTDQTIILYCVIGGFSTAATGQPETLPTCGKCWNWLNFVSNYFSNLQT